uniref:Ubiquitin family protein n=1 Tax=Musa acuminata subsp. malaccensis TaxID=214687 RepID=A0A804ISN9_MUSAM|nr:PREDICTED: ubiquitin domain-containing protein DSK2a isoform X1 [Musa acuminata subsp. malaccensis]
MADDGDSDDGSGPPSATVHIRCSSGSKFSVQTPLDATVDAFKAVVAGSCDVPVEEQRMIYKGWVLNDDQTLASYGVESDHTIHLIRGSARSAVSVNTEVHNQGPSRTSDRNSASGFFGTGIPEFDQMQQLTQNCNVTREIMNLPAIQNLINNPDIIRSLFMDNPQMREIIDRNPDLAHVLNDSSTLRQTLEAVRNPELMREVMRNSDRVMSNIESSPEGFNMLRRMYETVQEPFFNAATMGGDLGGNVGSNAFSALLINQVTGQDSERSSNLTTSSEPTTGSGPNTNPLPNPWGSNAVGAQPVSTRSDPGSTTGIPGLGGLGSLDMEHMVGRLQDSSQLSQVLQNPAMMQTMQNLLSDPQYVNQMLDLNPNMRGLLESNTQLREMLQNPDFLCQLMSPETMQQLLSFRQSMFSHVGRQQSSLEQGQTGGGVGTTNNTGLDFLINMFGGLGTGGPGVPNTSNVPPEELYATQLSQLQEMGFFDTQENIRALTATAGNVHAAVERLLGNSGQ